MGMCQGDGCANRRFPFKELEMRYALVIAVFLDLVWQSGDVRGQSADDITKLIQQLIELDSIDLAKNVKFREGLQPALQAVDADESSMRVLENPYDVFGQDKAGAAGWYRVSLTI